MRTDEMENSCKVITPSTRAEDILLSYPVTLLVFERSALPLRVGDKTLTQIAQERGIRVQLLINLLQLSLGRDLSEVSTFLLGDVPHLIDFLLNGHEYYINEANPNIAALLGSILPDTDTPNRELLRNFFDRYMHEAREHFDYEHDVVFPYARTLFANKDSSGYRMQEYKHRHTDIRVKLEDLQHLLLRYLPPLLDASLARRLLYALDILCTDLKIHTCIEDEVLIPLVEKMERRWNS